MAVAALALLAACGGGSGPEEEQTPDETSFCILVQRADPVDEASVSVLRRLDQIAPAEVDESVQVLRAGLERLAELEPGDPAALAVEYEVRFDAQFVAAREDVGRYVSENCGTTPP